MDKRKIDIIPQCLSISFKRKSNSLKSISGDDLYKRFVNVNSGYFWNLNLKEVFENCCLLGHLKPYCLLIGAEDIFIQSIKIAYKKRLLRAPESFYINYFGDLERIQCESILPSQFVSLDESLCYIIYDLNLNSEISSFDMICSRLAEWYPSLQLPPQFLILATLRSLLEAGQVYHTGYGYNIMTTDKMMVAHWLDQQSPIKSNTVSDPDDNDVHKSSSISEISNEDKSKLPQSFNYKPVKSMDRVNNLQYYSNTPPYFVNPDQTVKVTKTRSAVRQFFSKLKPRQSKSRPTSSVTVDERINNSYDDESFYAYSKSQPMFISSSADFPSGFTGISNKYSTLRQVNPNKQWLWNTSLQSLSNINSTCKRSVSSHSRVSTRAIHDDSPPINDDKVKESNYSKLRNSRHKKKSTNSSKTDRSSSGEYKQYQNYLTVDGLRDDSGVHSISGSHSKVTSEISIKTGRPTSHHRYNSLELTLDNASNNSQSITPPTSKDKTYHRLTRSFSTRLSNLDPVIENSKLNSQDNRHVMFKEHCGTMY